MPIQQVHGAWPNASESPRCAQFVRGLRRGDFTPERLEARAKAIYSRMEAAAAAAAAPEYSAGSSCGGSRENDELTDLLMPLAPHVFGERPARAQEKSGELVRADDDSE